MKIIHFPWIALGLGLLLLVILLKSGAATAGGPYLLPLLTLLLMNEIGLIACLVGVGIGYTGARKSDSPRPLVLAAIGCALLAAAFVWLGLTLWPAGGAFN